MNYLITGGTGFIGSYVARDLVREGEQVIIYDAFPNERSLNAAMNEEERGKLTMIQGDVLDLPHFLRTIKEYSVTVIIHMAYLIARASTLNPPLAIRVNCEGTNNVFEAIRLSDLRIRLVMASTVAVLGHPDKHKQEYVPHDAPHYPFNVYGACKSFDEHIAEYYFQQYGMDYIALRLAFVYGAGMLGGVAATVTKELIENPAMGKPGNVPFGDDTLPWSYVEDVARVTLIAAKAPQTKTRVFNVSGDPRPVREVADYVRKLFHDANLTLQPGHLGLCSKFETSNLEKEIGFKPKFSIEQGAKRVMNVVRQQQGLPDI